MRTELSLSDEWETPTNLFIELNRRYNFHCVLDAACNEKNSKCVDGLGSALEQEWVSVGDVWCNPPHSITKAFIRRADAMHKKYNINICMIVPTRCQSMAVWHELIEDEIIVKVENHPILKRPRFLKNGKLTKHPSQNAYRVIIWRHVDA